MGSSSSSMTCDLYTLCLIQDGARVLLINRPDKKGHPGYIGPGGKIEMPESPSEGAIREVLEETGLKAGGLVYKGLDEFVVPSRNYRYMVFNYIATSYEGELLQNPPEGELRWVSISEALDLPMQPWFKLRFPYFFEDGTFEIHAEWDEENEQTIKKTIHKL